MNYTLITGASSGIGFELARVFARNNHNLILVARSGAKLENLKTEIEKKYPVVAEVITADLSKPESADKLFEKIQGKNLEVDVLVNNAGFGDHGLFTKSDKNKNEEMVVLNILTLTKLTQLFLPKMIEKKYGKIMNVASTAAFQAGPLMTVYYATKAYVLSFSEGLSEELKGTGVSVTALCPGPTHSNFQTAANVSDIKMLSALNIPSSEDVAEYGYKALMKNKVVAVHGLVNDLLSKGSSLVPRPLLRKLVMKLQSKRIK